MGCSQLELTLDSWLNQPNSQDHVQKYKPYSAKFSASNVSLISPKSGVLKSKEGLNKLKNLYTYSGIRFKHSIGDKLTKTKDIFTSPGIIFLKGDDFNDIKKDIQTIRMLESSNELYTVN